MPNTKIIHGFKVMFEENAREGVQYLEADLDLNEAKVFFDQAKLKGSAQFEDDEERQFTLMHQRNDHNYVLIRRT
ncbi:MAG: hypothetical protein HYV52_03190 [Parcubacteria group bacterium]|nr:hypothetical protein [Parcubacteria group bacterium]